MTDTGNPVVIADLMEASGVQFGTSGARGRVEDMTDRVCYTYTAGFLQYLEAAGSLDPERRGVAVAGDLRPSTARIMEAVARAVADGGYSVIHCGRIPSPAVALFGLRQGVPSIMVTGSHIPDDRNGIKYNTPQGEILKQDEAGMRAQQVTLPPGLFLKDGALTPGIARALGPVDDEARRAYVQRYLDFFPSRCLADMPVGLYEHSSVARDVIHEVLSGLGARVSSLGRSDTFIPVDTEAIRPEDSRLAREWAREHAFHSLVSTDGDGDRPLISDENGNWLRGDVAGILCAGYLQADAVATPVSSNTALEKTGWFEQVKRTRIGSPFVIAAMQEAVAAGYRRVVGYEANGGFLTATDLELDGRLLPALPTRDTLVVLISLLYQSRARDLPISGLLAELPQRFTASDRLKEFPTEKSRAKLAELHTGNFEHDRFTIAAQFGGQFGQVAGIDTTDGLRISFESGEIVHLRPSGNAPEFRCYNEADTPERAAEMNHICVEIMQGWRQG